MTASDTAGDVTVSVSEESNNDRFADIRPYYDHEVNEVLNRVLNDAEFIDAIGKFFLPKAYNSLAFAIKPLIRLLLRWQTRKVVDVRSFQDVIEYYMRFMIGRTSHGLTHSGLEKLDKNQSYLFISNHRDIAMDPAFVNWILYHNGMDTVRIAIGDNLLTKPYASDLMRLNKSFLVNRSETAPRKLFAALKRLSEYIGFSVNEERSHVWIAQREGRAKDGNDKSEPAIIKMITMAKPKAMEFADYIRSLRIVPVAISYEWDPCDVAKARELYLKQTQGAYQKQTHEDVESIAKGITGNKGRVHVAFGEVLQADFADADAVAAELDKQIRGLYRLHPSNYLAWEKLFPGQSLPVARDNEILARQQPDFEARLAQCPAEYRDIFLQMYANPVSNCFAEKV